MPTPASPMTPKGGSQQVYGDPDQATTMMESPDTFRRRTTPVVGAPEVKPDTLQQILAMLSTGS
jgi:hypothetical protein